MDIVAHNSEKNKRYIPHEVRTSVELQYILDSRDQKSG